MLKIKTQLILALCTGRAVNFVWVSSGWDSETSYVVKDASGDVIFSGSAGSGMLKGKKVIR